MQHPSSLVRWSARLPFTRPAWWTPLRADAALALGLWAVTMLLWEVSPDWTPHPDAWSPLWALLTIAPMAIRRRWLWVAVAGVLLSIALGALHPPAWTGQGLALWVITYTVAARLGWWTALTGTAMMWVANDVALWYAVDAGLLLDDRGRQLISFPAGVVVNLVAMVVLFLIGRTVRARRDAAGALAERATAAEANQHAHAQQAVADERRRIARELHDVVAHHVSVIGVMAAGARRTLPRDEAATAEALNTIEQTSRITLRELRRMLFVLRTDSLTDSLTASEAGAPGAETQLAPQPDLMSQVTGIRALTAQVSEAGLPVALRVDGEPADLEPGVTLTAYRIVQEALTNSLKHAGPARAEVRVTFAPQLLTIEVFDTGRGPDPLTREGHGLVGMKERVAVYGGSLRAGPRPGGGFRVLAKIPLDDVTDDAPLPAELPQRITGAARA